MYNTFRYIYAFTFVHTYNESTNIYKNICIYLYTYTYTHTHTHTLGRIFLCARPLVLSFPSFHSPTYTHTRRYHRRMCLGPSVKERLPAPAPPPTPFSQPVLRCHNNEQANPCAGHACKDREYPHLEFEYSSTGRLSCHCTKPCPQGLCTGERKPPRCVEGGHHW